MHKQGRVHASSDACLLACLGREGGVLHSVFEIPEMAGRRQTRQRPPTHSLHEPALVPPCAFAGRICLYSVGYNSRLAGLLAGRPADERAGGRAGCPASLAAAACTHRALDDLAPKTLPPWASWVPYLTSYELVGIWRILEVSEPCNLYIVIRTFSQTHAICT